ncbi:MAG: hypothetical protein QOG53_1046 [Frankiales bacterium]|nr:hypothetical protein [Frankiales bacterium]
MPPALRVVGKPHWRRRTPRHLAPRAKPDRSLRTLAGHTAARGLGLCLVGLVAVLPAGLGRVNPSAAATGHRAVAPSNSVALFAATVSTRAATIELPYPAALHRRTAAVVHQKTAAAQPAGRWVRPGTGILTSPFGMRWGKLHKGIDLGAPYGSPVYAATDGVVTFAGFKNGYHRYVMIDHGHGLVTAYAHMSATFVHVGQHVRAGEQIAREGTEGSGPHLHFEIWRNGSPVNPIPILRKHGVYI